MAVPRPISSRMTSERAGRLVQDRRGLDHLDHEGGAAARQIVGGADAAEQAVDDADLRPTPPARSCPSAPACTISAFCRRKVDLPAMFGPVTSQQPLRLRERSQSLATKRRPPLRAAAPPRPPDGGRPRCRTRCRRRPAGRQSAALAPPARPAPRPRRARPARRPPRDRRGARRAPRRPDRRTAPARGPAPGRRPWRSCCSSSASSTRGEADGAGHGLAVDEAAAAAFDACRRGSAVASM